LPSFPITQSGFQTYAAQAAYLKDIAYFLALALFFLILPFHFIVATENEIRRARHGPVLDVLAGKNLAEWPSRALYPRFCALASLLVAFAAISLIMTAHLLDNLEPGPYMNLFTELVYLRGFLYFGLGIECLAWYYLSLNDIKRVCATELAR
jgi:hypothetical protein